MTEREARVELFKAVATFGAVAAVIFCLGVPLIFAFAPKMKVSCLKILIWVVEFVGFVVVACVLYFYYKLIRKK